MKLPAFSIRMVTIVAMLVFSGFSASVFAQANNCPVLELGNKFGQSPIGTGPFAFNQLGTQQYVKLVANDAYFSGAPKLAGITYRMILSGSARELEVATNEIDLIGGKREQRWVARARDRDMKVDIFNPAEFHAHFINRDIKLLDDLYRL